MAKKIATLSKTQAILNENNLKTKKGLGQNFLIDSNVIDSIVEESHITKDTIVLEIGAGIGALTESLVAHAKHVVSVEVDYELIPILEDNFKDVDNLDLIHDDILLTDLNELLAVYEGEEIQVVANLPYYITSDILFYLAESDVTFTNIVVMMQSEVADRLMSHERTSDYRAMTVIINNRFEVSKVMDISRNVFFPKPNVDSAVMSFIPKNDLKDIEGFNSFVKKCFVMRRKTLNNNLKSFMDKDSVVLLSEKASIDVSLRPQDLSVEEYQRMYEVYREI